MHHRPFWITLHGDRGPAWCGITAIDEEAAIRLISEAWFDGEAPDIVSIEVDVDVDEVLTRIEGRIRPLDVGIPVRPGIWYPNHNG